MIRQLLARHRFLAVVNLMVVIGIVGTVASDYWFEINYRTAANVALLIMATLVVFFSLLYIFRSRWKTNEIGLIYAVKCGALSLVLVQATVASWWDLEYPFRHQIRFMIYAIGALVYLPMLISLVRHQQRDRDDEDDDGEPTLRPDAPPL